MLSSQIYFGKYRLEGKTKIEDNYLPLPLFHLSVHSINIYWYVLCAQHKGSPSFLFFFFSWKKGHFNAKESQM